MSFVRTEPSSNGSSSSNLKKKDKSFLLSLVSLYSKINSFPVS